MGSAPLQTEQSEYRDPDMDQKYYSRYRKVLCKELLYKVIILTIFISSIKREADSRIT